MKNILIRMLLLVLAATPGVAQDLEQAFRNPVEFNGYLRMSGDFYDVEGIDPRRSPTSWSVSGSATLQLAGISFPVSFVFRDQRFSYGASFNQFGASPYYKWIKVHLGWRNMTFSPYTLTGRTFLGGGFELTPGSFRLSGFYGTFRNLLAIQDTIVYGSSLLPVYDRKAFGGKIGFAGKYNHFSIMAVKAWDDVGTPDVDEDLPNPYYFAYAPKENLILGASFNLRLFKKLDLYGNAGASAFTENTEIESVYEEDLEFLNDVYVLNATSRFALAGDIGARVRIRRTSLGVQYKRIEPFYSTLTTEFFYNDIENITAQLSTSTRKGTARFSGNLGFEHNNLLHHQSVTSKRVIGAVNLSLTPIQPLILQLRYSNYAQDSESGLLTINDTLRLATTTANYGLTANYMFGQQRDQQLALYTGRTTIVDQSPVKRLQDLTTDMLSLTYSWFLADIGLRLSPSVHYNRYDYESSLQERYGFGAGASKSFMDKKLNLQYVASYSRNDIDAKQNGYVWNNRWGVTYKPYTAGAINLSLQHIANRAILQADFTEWRGRIQYTHQLGL